MLREMDMRFWLEQAEAETGGGWLIAAPRAERREGTPFVPGSRRT
jgi:hypothetical protein